MLDLINEIWQTMRTNKLRTALTGISVAWGIFMLIMLVGLAKGVLNSFADGDFAKSANIIQIWPGYASMPYKGLKEGRLINLRDTDLGKIERENKEVVKYAAAQLNMPSTNISTSRDYISKSYIGVFPEAQEQLVMSHGRFINDHDLELQRKVIVLDKKSAETLFGSEDKAVGNVVNMTGLSFTVAGVYDHQWKSDLYIPYTTARALKGYDDKLSTIRVSASGINTLEKADELEKKVRTTLGKSESFDSDDSSAVWVWNRFSSYISNQKGMGILNTVMWVIGLLTLITGIVGVSNIMFVSVRERTHEIGIRRAIGAKPMRILKQVILESVAMTTIFGYVGILLGTIGTEILSRAFAGSDFIKDPTVSISLALEVTLVLIIAGALAGLFPAMRALKIRPVEALRTE
ncbi:MAG: ABC transporter permease [Muribaculum sp.]|nr:ABC transporter permease [Muribaculum sp.]MDE6457863.1 ABC transporter permease [Muribaculum sp.]